MDFSTDILKGKICFFKSDNMKVLIITKHYLDQSLGGPNCSKAFVKALTSIYNDCVLIYPEHNDHTTSMPFINADNVKIVPCYDKRSKLKKGIDTYFGRIHRFGEFVRDFLRKNTFDIIFIDHSFTASSGVIKTIMKTNCKIVTLHHNVESNYIKDNKQSILFRYPYNYFSLRAEHNAIINSNLNLTLTEADKACFSKKYIKQKNTFEVMGIFEYADRDTNVTCTPDTQNFVISGSLSARQTETALIAFITDYIPVLNNLCPHCKVIITGRNPSKTLINACNRFDNIILVPNPDNLLKEIAKGSYYICPLFTGSGIKLRIMDALYLGLPVIAHDISVKGYENIVNNNFMFGYNNIESFRHAVKQVLPIKEYTEIRECFLSTFSFMAGRNRLLSILKRHNLIDKF